MSLCLLAVHHRHAVIVSDGAASAVLPDGTWQRARNDYPKFRKVGAGLVLAATGPLVLAEQIWDDVAEYVRASPGVTFDHVSRFLATHLPTWHDRFAAQESFEHDVAVTLAGYDRKHARARLMVFGPSTGYAPIDAECTVMGAARDPQGLLAAAVDKAPSVIMLSRMMRSALVKLARESPEIGGSVFACEIGPQGVTSERSGAELPANLTAVGVRLGVTPHLQGSYQTFTATKTANYPARMLQIYDDNPPTTPASHDADGNLQPSAVPGESGQLFVAAPDIPTGVTLTGAEFDLSVDHLTGGGSFYATMQVMLRRSASHTETDLGHDSPGSTGWQTIALSLSESVSAGRSYSFRCSCTPPAGGGSATVALFGPMRLIYSMPDPTKAR